MYAGGCQKKLHYLSISCLLILDCSVLVFSLIYNLIFHSLIEFSGVFLNEKPDFNNLIQPSSD